MLITYFNIPSRFLCADKNTSLFNLIHRYPRRQRILREHSAKCVHLLNISSTEVENANLFNQDHDRNSFSSTQKCLPLMPHTYLKSLMDILVNTLVPSVQFLSSWLSTYYLVQTSNTQLVHRILIYQCHVIPSYYLVIIVIIISQLHIKVIRPFIIYSNRWLINSFKAEVLSSIRVVTRCSLCLIEDNYEVYIMQVPIPLRVCTVFYLIIQTSSLFCSRINYCILINIVATTHSFGATDTQM